MVRLLTLYLSLALLMGCSGLSDFLSQPISPGSSTTIGDSVAKTVDTISEPTSNVVSSVTTALTGNPVLGGVAAALIAALLAMGSKRIRRRKKQGGGSVPTTT